MLYQILLVCVVALGATQAVTVNTKYGDVQGQSHTLHNGKSVNSYLAIPFAKPPVGELRFQKSQEPEPWDETFVADTLGNACEQGRQGIIWLTQPFWSRYGEDCLNMNVYTPQDMGNGPYAVMVWFHGGAYSSSANIQYPGYFMAAKDVVVVVPNYRLGIFGFASTGDEVAPGNWGLWDQNLALKFVQENIANFGGDPTRVTIFGQSAGAGSSGIHVVSPESAGLFHRAIYESGSEFTLWALNYPEENPENYIRQVASRNYCPDAVSSQAIIECLRSIDAQELRGNSGFECAEGHFCLGWAPVVDGPGGLLPNTPQDLRYEGKFNYVDLMGGHCNKDGSFYTLSFIPEAEDGGFNSTTFHDIIKYRLIDYFGARVDYDNKTMENVFEAIRFFYTPWPNVEDEEGNRQAFNDMITDVGFGYPSDSVYKSHQEVANVYNFILGYRSAAALPLVPEWIGVPHNGELPYVWGWPLLQLNPSIRIESGIVIDIIEWDETDIVYTDYIQEMWANFAKYGDPTPEPIEAPDGGMTKWERFTLDERNYLDINNTIEAKVNYKQQNMAFWQEYIPYITGIDTTMGVPAKHINPVFHGLSMSSDQVEKATNKVIMEAVHKKLGI